MTDTNCPNCGAPIVGPVCEYCGTRHWDFKLQKNSDNSEHYIQLDLYAAMTKNLESQRVITRLYEEAIRAMRGYSNT